MRVVGLVSELHHQPGVYGHGRELDPNTLQDQWAELAELGDTTYSRVGREATESLITLSELLLPTGLLVNHAVERLVSALLQPIGRIGALPTKEGASGALPPQGAIVIPAARIIHGFRRHADPVLYGLFRSARELRRTMSAEGGNVDLWILPLNEARTHFRHHGGDTGRFSLGLYLPHPKDPGVLIPARGFSELLRDQVLQDWVRAFEALGAKSIVICDTTRVSGSSGIKATDGGIDVAAELKAQYGKEVVRESTYGPGTFDSSRALAGKRWIADYAAVQSIVEGRTDGRQLGYRERVGLDISFGLDSSVLRAWGVKIKGGYKRTFELAVQFYPKNEAL